MSWTWYHWIPNWASAENGQTSCAITTGTAKEFYGAQNLVDDNPHRYCIFTPGSGTTVEFLLNSVGGGGGTICNNIAIVNDDLPSDATIAMFAMRRDSLKAWAPAARGTDEIYVRAFGSNDNYPTWLVSIANLTAYTWYRIGLIIIAREEEFSDQPTMPYDRRPFLDGPRHDGPAGRPFHYLKRHGWEWTLTWNNARRLCAITRAANYQRVYSDKPFMIWDPEAQEYFYVRIVDPIASSYRASTADSDRYLHDLKIDLREAI